MAPRSASISVVLTLCLGACSNIIIESSSDGDGTSGDGDGDGTEASASASASGDGDGDSASGDGDGDPASGDGDGDDPSTGDGDGDPPPGDGDGDDSSTGDGDGDPLPGDGDGDDPSTGDGDGDPFPDLPAASVLLLGDGVHDETITASLEGAGHTVTSGGNYWDWNNNPDVDNFDVVVYIEIGESGGGLRPMARTAVEAFLMAGGALIRTEWAAFSLSNPAEHIDVFLPVRSPLLGFEYSTTWSVVDPQHPLTKDMPAGFVSVEGGCSVVEAEPGATVIFTSDLCGPALTFREVGVGGHVVHINDDFGGDQVADPTPEILQLLDNAVRWSAAN